MISGLRDGAAKFAVLGSPIAHSKSPLIHNAAYEFYGFKGFSFVSIDVPEAEFAGFMRDAGSEFAGFAVTMPLKKLAAEHADWQSELVQTTGVANTLVRENGRLKAFNTDIPGLREALLATGKSLGTTAVLGAGATALSAGIAAIQGGAKRLIILARKLEAAQELSAKIAGLNEGIECVAQTFQDSAARDCDFVISTLPGGVAPELDELTKTKPLFDVAYDPWPSALGATWGAEVYSGLEMLLRQAIVQLRIFVGEGDENAYLPDESELIAHLGDKLGLK